MTAERYLDTSMIPPPVSEPPPPPPPPSGAQPRVAHAHTEDDVKALTLHVYGRAIALGSTTVEDARGRVLKMLDWLSAAGRLQPAPTEVRTEYAVWWHRGVGDGICLDEDRLPSAAKAHQLGQQRIGEYGITRYTIHRREHRLFADGSTWIGAWQPVEEET